MRKKPFVIGVCGGSGSGKTTVARNILEIVGRDRVAHLLHDHYYRDLGDLTHEERSKVNFDHPDSLDNALFKQHLRLLSNYQPVECPVYDFKTHRRTEETFSIFPRQVVVVEGILIFADAELRSMMDLRVFVDTDADLRVLRRINRDVAERGRTLDSVIQQYLDTVRPMHNEFVAPGKKYANLVLPEGGMNEVAIDILITKVESVLKQAIPTQPLKGKT
ncbi:MAG: uridine kinase [Candidatus Sericytochromatia bacterium]